MRLFCCIFACCGLLAQDRSTVQLTIDTSEADQALAILNKASLHQQITEEDWAALFRTEPYRWLKEREAAMGRSLTDEDFRNFLLSPAAIEKQEDWRSALAAIKGVNMAELGDRTLAWLPRGATIHSRVFPEIKPQHNSFVWTKPGEGPAIFLYLERQSRQKSENTVAHECHHIGLQSVKTQQEAVESGLPPAVKRVVRWMGAFGEGAAMLAAAGSGDAHPHWEDDALVRARWDGDLMRFDSDLAKLQHFFTDILDGKLTDDAAIMRSAAPFWGDAQGAWYTVGYEMAVLVEKRYGRAVFTECLIDPRKLLSLYNEIAKDANASGAKLAMWSPAFLARLNTQP